MRLDIPSTGTPLHELSFPNFSSNNVTESENMDHLLVNEPSSSSNTPRRRHLVLVIVLGLLFLVIAFPMAIIKTLSTLARLAYFLCQKILVDHRSFNCLSFRQSD